MNNPFALSQQQQFQSLQQQQQQQHQIHQNQQLLLPNQTAAALNFSNPQPQQSLPALNGLLPMITTDLQFPPVSNPLLTSSLPPIIPSGPLTSPEIPNLAFPFSSAAASTESLTTILRTSSPTAPTSAMALQQSTLSLPFASVMGPSDILKNTIDVHPSPPIVVFPSSSALSPTDPTFDNSIFFESALNQRQQQVPHPHHHQLLPEINTSQPPRDDSIWLSNLLDSLISNTTQQPTLDATTAASLA
ncbi:hypothetical protein HK102_005743, partial [Quaeritorhiza haematococci]